MQYTVNRIISNQSFGGICLARDIKTNQNLTFVTKSFVFQLNDSFKVDIQKLNTKLYNGVQQYLLDTNSDYEKITIKDTKKVVKESLVFKNKTLKTFKFPNMKDYSPEDGKDTVWGFWADTDGQKYVGVVNPERFVKNAVFSVEGIKEESGFGPQIKVSSIVIRSFDLNKPEFLLKNLGFNNKSIDWALRDEFINMISDKNVLVGDIEKEIRRGKKNKEFSGIGEKTIVKIMKQLSIFRDELEDNSDIDITTKFKNDLRDLFVEYRVNEFWNNTEAGRTRYIDKIHKGFVSILEGNQSKDFTKKYEVSNISEIVSLIRTNPYVLILLPNKGFKTVDLLARQMGIDIGSLERQEACVNGILDGNIHGGFGSSGDIYLDRESLFSELVGSLTIEEEEGFLEEFNKKDSDLLFQKLREEGNTNFYSWMSIDDEGLLTEKFTNKKNFDEEQIVFESVKQAVETDSGSRPPIMDRMKLGSWILDFEKKESLLLGIEYKLSDEQREAVQEINSNNQSIFCMTGFAGTGKSTVSKAILELLEIENEGIRKGIECLAVSGMASRRITEATGFQSSTIMSYSFNPKRAKETKILFIDEASMVDSETMAMLFQKINMNKVKVILVGDVGQLPPIGRGTPFKDILESGWVRTVSLEKIFRQNEDAVLTTFAKGMREEDIPETMFEEKHSDFEFIQVPDYSISKIRKEISILEKIEEPNKTQKNNLSSKRFDLKKEMKICNMNIKEEITNLLYEYKSDFDMNFNNFQLISPQKSTIVGTEELNRLAQDILNDKTKPFIEGDIKIGASYHYKRFKIGDKVIHTKNENWFVGTNLGFYVDGSFTKMSSKISDLKNNYAHKLGSEWVIRILNGMVGEIEEYNKVTKIIRVKYQYEDIQIGVEYAFKDLGTLHLGYCLTVHKLQGSEAKTVVFVVSPSHIQMINNNLLYTGLTRGKTKGYLVGSKLAFKQGLKKHGTIRQTMLPLLFEGLFWDLNDEAKRTIMFEADDWNHSPEEFNANNVMACSTEKGFDKLIENIENNLDTSAIPTEENDEDWDDEMSF